MSLSDRLQEIRTGFERPFWVANLSEIFERLSYYAVFAALARYLDEALQFPTQEAATLSGIFGGAVWVMAIFGGALADLRRTRQRAVRLTPTNRPSTPVCAWA